MLNVGRILLTGIYHEKPRPGVGMEGRCKEIVAHLSVVIYNLIVAVTCNSPFLTMVHIQYVKVLYLVSIIIWLNSREAGTVSSLNRARRGLTSGESGSRGAWWECWRNWSYFRWKPFLPHPRLLRAARNGISSFSPLRFKLRRKRTREQGFGVI